MKYRKEYNMPDGRRTVSVRKMISAWRKLYTPFCKVTGAEAMGYDPDVLFIYKNKSFELPVGILKNFNKNINPKSEFVKITKVRKNIYKV